MNIFDIYTFSSSIALCLQSFPICGIMPSKFCMTKTTNDAGVYEFVYNPTKQKILSVPLNTHSPSYCSTSHTHHIYHLLICFFSGSNKLIVIEYSLTFILETENKVTDSEIQYGNSYNFRAFIIIWSHMNSGIEIFLRKSIQNLFIELTS